MFEAQVNYGMFKRGCDYKVVKEGYDWCLVAVKGKTIYVPKWVFENE